MAISRLKSTVLISGAGIVALFAAQQAAAQTPPPVEPGDPRAALTPQADAVPDEVAKNEDADIVVTAQRRAQNLRDVPVSMQAFGTEQLAAAGVSSTDSLVALTPSLGINKFLAPFQSSIRIRGVGSNVSSPMVESSVSMVVDGVVISRQASFFTDLVDIERIEILRGPQSTLFGKNAVAGALNITTSKPSLTGFEGLGEVTFNSFRDLSLRGTLSGPITPNLGLRVTGSFSDEGRGVIKNIFGAGPSLSGEGSQGVRAKLLWEPDADSDLTLVGDYRHSAGPNTIRVPVAFESLNVQNFYGIGPVDRDNRRVSLNGGPLGGSLGPHNYSSDDWGVSLEGNTKLGALTLTSITAYRKYTLASTIDTDGTSSLFNASGYDDLVTVAGVGSVAAGRYVLQQSHVYGQLRTDQISQEVRLTSPDSGDFRWLVGGFYWKTTLFFDNRQILGVCNFNTAAPGFTAPPPRPVLGDGDPQALTGSCSFPAPNGVYSRFRTNYDVDTEYVAAFGQFDWNITPSLTLTGGLRYQRDKFEYVIDGGLGNTITVPGTTDTIAPFRAPGRQINNVLTGKASLGYKIDSYNNIYASYSRGYKGPGLDGIGNRTVAPAGPLRPEYVHAYELGYKGRLFDSLNLNVAFFWQNFRDLQQQAFNFPLNALQAINAGESRQRGVEADAAFRVSSRLRVNAGVTYLDSTYTSFTNSDCFAPRVRDVSCVYTLVPGAAAIGTKDVSGAPNIYSPKWSYNVGLDYRVPIGRSELVMNANYRFVGEQLSTSSQDPSGVLPSYGLLDLRAGIELVEGQYTITGFVNNVFDKSYPIFVQSNSYSGQVGTLNQSTSNWVFPKNAERHYGVTVRARF